MLTHATKFNVIHIVSKPDCDDFRGIYEGLDGDILINPSKGQVKSIIRTYSDRPLILIGHGTEDGLLNKDWNGYVVDSNIVDMLRKVPCIIGVWCYAGNFADRYDLHGFFTSMFISTEEEAACHGFLKATPEDIQQENILFSKRLNKLLKVLCFVDGKPLLGDWMRVLGSKADISKGFVRFNYEAMGVF